VEVVKKLGIRTASGTGEWGPVKIGREKTAGLTPSKWRSGLHSN
jgi:hypothetical protein